MTTVPTVPGLPTPGRTLVMGVVNVTPDSFSDGGSWFDPEHRHRLAVQHGLDLLAEGADIIDVGGESTRPGAVRVDAEEEWRRVGPVVRALVAEGAIVSVDTMRAVTAAAAVQAGARLVNDVSGGHADEAMLATIAGLDVPFVCMHWRGHSAQMQQRAVYTDVAAEVAGELSDQLDEAVAKGIGLDRLVIDPGFGFAKTGEHNWTLMRDLERVERLGRPLVVGVSRKAFLGALLADDAGPRPPTRRDDASLALTVLLAQRSVWCVRVHTVRPHRDAVEVVARLAAETARLRPGGAG